MQGVYNRSFPLESASLLLKVDECKVYTTFGDISDEKIDCNMWMNVRCIQLSKIFMKVYSM